MPIKKVIKGLVKKVKSAQKARKATKLAGKRKRLEAYAQKIEIRFMNNATRDIEKILEKSRKDIQKMFKERGF